MPILLILNFFHSNPALNLFACSNKAKKFDFRHLKFNFSLFYFIVFIFLIFFYLKSIISIQSLPIKFLIMISIQNIYLFFFYLLFIIIFLHLCKINFYFGCYVAIDWFFNVFFNLPISMFSCFADGNLSSTKKLQLRSKWPRLQNNSNSNNNTKNNPLLNSIKKLKQDSQWILSMFLKKGS